MKQNFFSSLLIKRPLALLTVLISLLLALPVFTVVSHLLSGSFTVWQHLYDTVLWDYLYNSWWLMVGVGLGCAHHWCARGMANQCV